MKYNKLMIENFRGITKLELADLKRINLLVGKNNCGKTTILEAIFLLSGMSNPSLSLNIHNFRDLILTDNEDLRYMFRDLSFTTSIKLTGIINSCIRKLTITPSYGFTQSNKNVTSHITGTGNLYATSDIRTIECLNLDFEIDKKNKFHGELQIKDGLVNVKMPEKYKENLPCTYLSPKTSDLVNDKFIEELLIHKKLTSIISVLKIIEPNIQDIRMGTKGMVYVDIGIDRLIPINIMGDGMRKILTILVAIAARKDGILLIDEIENGFHYSFLPEAWTAIFVACREYNVQLVASTHSYECIEAFLKAYNSLDPNGNNICLFRIDRDKKNYKACPYTTEILSAGIDKKFEVR